MLARLGCLLAVSSCARRSRGTYWPNCPATATEMLMASPLLSFPIAPAVSGHVHGCFQGCKKKNRGVAQLCALMTALALLPCLRPETSSWAGSGCTGRHDGPATARSKGAVPGSTGASNSKLSATNC